MAQPIGGEPVTALLRTLHSVLDEQRDVSQDLFDQTAEALRIASTKERDAWSGPSADGRLRGGSAGVIESDKRQIVTVWHKVLWKCPIGGLTPESVRSYIWPEGQQYPDDDRLNAVMSNQNATREMLLPLTSDESGGYRFGLPSDARRAIEKRFGS